MPARRLTVSVPQPCQEDWHSMVPQFQGRFCQNCQKTVVDFTSMTDAEVVRWLSEQTGQACGRFRPDQLGKELATASGRRKRWRWRAALLGLTAWLGTKTGEAQQLNPKYIHELPAQGATSQPQEEKSLDAAPSLPDPARLVKGVVMEAGSKQNIPGVTIFIKGTTIGTATDKDGKFEITIPEHLPLQEQTLVFSFIGMEYQEKKLPDLLKMEHAIISLTPDKNALMGEVVVVDSRRHSPRNFLYKLRTLFR